MTLPRLEYEHIQNKDFIIFPQRKGVKKHSFKFKLERKKNKKKNKTKKKKLKSKSIFSIF